MTKVDELITKLLNEKLFKRFDNLEKRFTREATDIASLEFSVDGLKKTLRDCENLSKELEKMAEHIEVPATPKKINESISKQTSTLTSHRRDKSLGRDKSMVRDKSMGRSFVKADDKYDKTLTKTKTLTNIKKQDDLKSSMSKTKSTLNLNKNESSKNLPKTPKAEKKTIAFGHSPDKLKSSKNLLTTPSTAHLKNNERENDDNSKTMRRNPTSKNLKDDKSEKTLDKSASKTSHLNRVGTKSTFASRAKESEKRLMTEPDRTTLSNGHKESGKKSNITEFNKKAFVKATHPSRFENISVTIGVETHNNDELLTKEESFCITGFQDKNEILHTTVSKLDYAEILDDRWTSFSKYLNRKDQINVLFSNKLFGKLSVTHLITEVQKDILENESKIKALRDKNSNDDLNKEQVNFALTRGAIKAVELLNETLYYKLFTEGPIPNEDIILTYRIFFQLLNMKDYVNIKDNSEFWKKVCEYFVSESNSKLGSMVTGLVKNIDFSIENIYKISKLVGNNTSKMTPNYFSKMCGTTGLFIFLIKDALEYSGILIDKKTPVSRLYKNCMYNFEILQGKMERMKRIQSTYFI